MLIVHRHHEPTIYAAQVQSSFDNLPLTLLVAVINSFILGFVLSAVVTLSLIALWIGLVVMLSALRMVLWWVYQRHAEIHSPTKWAVYVTGGTLLSGILWGSTPLLFAPLDDIHLLFLTLILAGMSAGSATVHAAYLPSVVAFIVPSILPMAITFFHIGGRVHVATAIMMVIFAIALCFVGMRFGQWFRATTSARLELNTSNQRLKEEIASHRTTEAKLHEAQKLEAIGRLTGGIAHDFNNLLMAIGGAAALIARRADPKNIANLKTIAQGVERGAALTRRLLAFGRQQPLMPCALDVNEFLSGLKPLLLATLAGYGNLVLRLAPRRVVAFADASELEQAILNLVINARDAMSDSGTVTISTKVVSMCGEEGLVGDYVQISVADTGLGMPEHVRLRAFEPFFTTKGVGKGSGLGLSQVYGVMKQSGGATRIDSTPGEGTTVTVYLPVGVP